MKPRYIFSSVSVIIMMMVFMLPKLAYHPASASPAANIPAAGAGITPTATPDSLLAAGTMNPTAAPESPDPAAEIPTLAPVITLIPPEVAVAPPTTENIQSAAVNTGPLPGLDQFISSLVNNQPNLLVGVYVPDILAMPVIQQPNGDQNFIDTNDGTLTQYGAPAQFSVIGLLAHNFLSGKRFFDLKMDSDVVLVYGDGHTANFRITGIQSYQALSPNDSYSDFIDLSDPQAQVIPFTTVFNSMYTHSNQVVFQTCIEANGDPSWGRLFVIATPAS